MSQILKDWSRTPNIVKRAHFNPKFRLHFILNIALFCTRVNFKLINNANEQFIQQDTCLRLLLLNEFINKHR